MKPQHQLADIIHRYGKAFLVKHPQDSHHLRTLQTIAHCRTKVLGGHKCKCKRCGHKKYFYNSCRNRHCPKCQAVNAQKWILQREAELLPVGYYHMVFTLPHQLNELAEKYPRKVYGTLFFAAWQTVKTFAGDPKYLGAKTGMTAIVHTWGEKLWLHPHLHCIVPAGGITEQGKWKHLQHKDKYLFPQLAMSSVYRAKFVKKLRASGVNIPQAIAKALFEKDWIIYAKRPFATPNIVLNYLSRYIHKIAISNHRLISIREGIIEFGYKDYRKGAQQLSTKLSTTEFLRRFCLHILPHGFTRIRHYGILASKNKAKELNLAKKELGAQPWEQLKITWKEIAAQKLGISADQCPKCKSGILEIVEIILPQRGPPLFAVQPELYYLKL